MIRFRPSLPAGGPKVNALFRALERELSAAQRKRQAPVNGGGPGPCDAEELSWRFRRLERTLGPALVISPLRDGGPQNRERSGRPPGSTHGALTFSALSQVKALRAGTVTPPRARLLNREAGPDRSPGTTRRRDTMGTPSDSTTFRMVFELEIAGTDQEVRSALARNVDERTEWPAEPGIVREPAARSREEAEESLRWIIGGLQLENQVRRVLSPLTARPVSGGLRLVPVSPADGEES
jgi:hypothetical protein